MTSLAIALSVDSRGPSALYIITDSRITWGSGDHRWDAGQKTFVSMQTPDIFGYCGDAYFPPAILRQVLDQVNAGVLLTTGMGALERNAILTEAFERGVGAVTKVAIPPFAIYHAARDGEHMKSRFRVFHTKYSKAEGFVHGELVLDASASYLAHLDGSGKGVIESRRSDWVDTDAEGTSRAAIWTFCEALHSGVDPLSGGAPQLVGLWRKDQGQQFGFLWYGKRFFAGLEVKSKANFDSVRWFNQFFERADGQTGTRMKGAQKQRKPLKL